MQDLEHIVGAEQVKVDLLYATEATAARSLKRGAIRGPASADRSRSSSINRRRS
jgi:hypothetical protein